MKKTVLLLNFLLLIDRKFEFKVMSFLLNKHFLSNFFIVAIDVISEI